MDTRQGDKHMIAHHEDLVVQADDRVAPDRDMQPPAARRSGMQPTYSVVAPIYNEAETLPTFYRRVTAVMDGLDEPFELVLVDDGSRDGSARLLRTLQERDPRVRVVTFSRNFGHQAAISAGLDHARGI